MRMPWMTASPVAAVAALLIACLLVTIRTGAEQGDEPATRPATSPDQTTGQPEPAKSFTQRLVESYDTSNPQIDLAGLFGPGVTRDGIPALTDPKRTKAANAEYPPDDGRVVAVRIGAEAVAYPLGILNWHEIANDEVDGVPVAVTYCPLCDSVAVLDRRLEITGEDGGREMIVLEFGVSGLLYNSNVVMYDRSTLGLWSQVYMQAVTGPHAGRFANHLTFDMMTFAEFRAAYPDGEVLTTETGHERPYRRNPYAGYFTSDRLFMEMDYDEALPAKALGLGVRTGSYAVFVTAEAAMKSPIELDTPAGKVRIIATEQAGVQVKSKPPDVHVVQTFWHSWSAFFPDTLVIGKARSDKQ